MKLLLLFFMFAAAALSGQDLHVEEADALPLTKYYLAKANAAMDAGEGQMARKFHDSIRYALEGKTVSNVYLEDQHGEVWDLGVLNQPFVVHVIAGGGPASGAMVPAINASADEFANEIVSFLLMPASSHPDQLARVATLSKSVVLVYVENPKPDDQLPEDTRLLGLIGYPSTFYIDGERVIAGVQTGARVARLASENSDGTTEAEALKANVGRIRKAVKRLLKGKRIRR